MEIMKKILNKAEDTVHEMCAGIAIANTELVYNSQYKFLRKSKLDPNKVTLISGGGSGHEPAHAGYRL